VSSGKKEGTKRSGLEQKAKGNDKSMVKSEGDDDDDGSLPKKVFLSTPAALESHQILIFSVFCQKLKNP